MPSALGCSGAGLPGSGNPNFVVHGSSRPGMVLAAGFGGAHPRAAGVRGRLAGEALQRVGDPTAQRDVDIGQRRRGRTRRRQQGQVVDEQHLRPR